VREVSYVEERLAEIRATTGSPDNLPSSKHSKIKAIRKRLITQRKIVAISNVIIEGETPSRIEHFVELAQQLRREDAEMTEK
jgi:hypothetical protein